MLRFTQANLASLAVTAGTASAYLDACDAGARYVRLDPAYYRACGDLLMKIFLMVNANKDFPLLLEQSAAARDVAESIQVGRRLELNQRVFYPRLAVLLKRAAA